IDTYITRHEGSVLAVRRKQEGYDERTEAPGRAFPGRRSYRRSVAPEIAGKKVREPGCGTDSGNRELPFFASAAPRTFTLGRGLVRSVRTSDAARQLCAH